MSWVTAGQSGPLKQAGSGKGFIREQVTCPLSKRARERMEGKKKAGRLPKRDRA